MKIGTKGLLLVTVPLLFQFVFVGSLVMMQQRVYELADVEKVDYELAAATTSLAKDFITVGATIVKRRRMSDAEFVDAYNAAMEVVRGDAETIYRWLDADPALQVRKPQLKERIDKLLSLLTEYRVDEQGKLQGKYTGNFYHSALPDAYKGVQEELASLEDVLRQKRESNPLATARAREQLRLLVWIGLVCSAIITIATARFFTRSISDRLRVMEINTHRFVSKQPLMPAVPGSDEIASLDAMFHSMVASINQAEERKNEFLAMISHDIRAPLMSLTATLKMVVKGIYGGLNDSGVERVKDAQDSADRIVSMINELLDVERLESGALPLSYTASPACELISSAVANVRALAETKSIRIESVGADSVAVNADAKRVVQVLTNLLSNALKYSPEGSVISVSVNEDGGGKAVKFSVKDQGPGIAAEHQQTLFDRYVQVDTEANREHVGSGLGLAICKGLVEAHGGRIGVNSEPGQGAEFSVILPKEKEGALK